MVCAFRSVALQEEDWHVFCTPHQMISSRAEPGAVEREPEGAVCSNEVLQYTLTEPPIGSWGFLQPVG